MNCPVCNETLLLTNRQEVEIDYCPKCRGIWLDRGELDKIIERSFPQSAEKPYALNSFVGKHHDEDDYERDDHNEHNYQRGHFEPGYDKHVNPVRRKKGFLGDLFDF